MGTALYIAGFPPPRNRAAKGCVTALGFRKSRNVPPVPGFRFPVSGFRHLRLAFAVILCYRQ